MSSPARHLAFLMFRRPGAKQIVGEGAQARGNVGVLADARRVLGEGCVAHVMAAVLDAPVPADPCVPLLWRKARRRGDPEYGLALRVQSPVAELRRRIVRSRRSTVLMSFSHGVREHHALASKTFSSRVSKRLRPFGLAPRAVARLASRRSERELSAQARLVVLHLRQQMIAGRYDALKSFFDSARRRA